MTLLTPEEMVNAFEQEDYELHAIMSVGIMPVIARAQLRKVIEELEAIRRRGLMSDDVILGGSLEMWLEAAKKELE